MVIVVLIRRSSTCGAGMRYWDIYPHGVFGSVVSIEKYTVLTLSTRNGEGLEWESFFPVLGDL